MSEKQEPYPVDASITVLQGIDIYHTNKWWKAVLKTKTKWGEQIAVYMWIKKDGKWKRRQKASFKSKDELDKTYRAIVKLMGW